MTTFSLIALGSSVLYHWWISFMMDTTNFRSTFLFKMLPFGIGVALAAVILFELGMIVPPTAGD